jgi:rhodanese-related sulfurtransferase
MLLSTLRRAALPLSLLLASSCATVSGQEGRALVQGGALLLDVRSPEEFAAGHLDGALNIPVGELEQRLAEVGPKERPVVVYCRSGARSSRARSLLLAKGWQRVENLGSQGNWPSGP